MVELACCVCYFVVCLFFPVKLRSTEAVASYIYAQLQLLRYNDLLAFELKEASSGESMEIVFSLHELVAKALNFREDTTVRNLYMYPN